MDEQALIKEVSLPLYLSKGWLKFLGVMSIIWGALSAITVVGLVIAWLPIWQGILLFKAATAAENAQITGDKGQLMLSLQQFKTFFMIMGITIIVSIGLAVIFGVLFMGAIIAALSSSGMSGY
jgi:hypothetical protein